MMKIQMRLKCDVCGKEHETWVEVHPTDSKVAGFYGPQATLAVRKLPVSVESMEEDQDTPRWHLSNGKLICGSQPCVIAARPK